MKIEHITLTDIGKREKNEDSLLFLDLDNNYHLAIIADGMGGHKGGEYASSSAIKYAEELFKNVDLSKINIIDELEIIIKRINLFIYQEGLSNNELTNMGTTLTLFLFNDLVGYIAQVGDSRLYKITRNDLLQLTEDQTLVNELYKARMITKEQIATHPRRHMLTNALGSSNSVLVARQKITLENGYYLLCSDGLSNEVDEKSLLEIVKSSFNIQEKGKMLIDVALKNGGTDNISIILIGITL